MWVVSAFLAGFLTVAVLIALTTPRTVAFSFDRVTQASSQAGGVSGEQKAVQGVATLKTDQALTALLSKYNSGITTTSGVVVMDLSKDTIAGVNANKQFISASLYKLFVAERLYALRAAGQLSFNSKIAITRAAAAEDAGTLIWPVGTKVSINDCMTRMITVSDNACGYVLGTLVGWGMADRALHESGYSTTTLSYPQKTSAQDVGTLLRAVSQGQMVDQASSDELRRLLLAQKINTRLPAGLPAGTLIGHKTGDLDGYAHDAGIVTSGGKSYVVAVLSGPWPRTDSANSSIAGLSGQIYKYVIGS
jgi:beta-lactamase class A